MIFHSNWRTNGKIFNVKKGGKYVMKKLFIVATAIVLIFGAALSAPAALVTITFDEAGINMGDTITEQYAAFGVHWDATYGDEITVGPNFNHPFDSEGQILWYNGTPKGIIQLDTLAYYLSFDFRRPSAPNDIYLAIYDTTTASDVLVHDFGRIGWDGGDWSIFTYNGEFGDFNKIEMYCSNKFVIDNLSVNMVPIPPSVLLLATGLIPLMFRRKRTLEM